MVVLLGQSHLVVKPVVVVPQEAEPKLQHVAPVGADFGPGPRQVLRVPEEPRVPPVHRVHRLLAPLVVEFLRAKNNSLSFMHLDLLHGVVGHPFGSAGFPSTISPAAPAEPAARTAAGSV